jgi:hypothetical protein
LRVQAAAVVDAPLEQFDDALGAVGRHAHRDQGIEQGAIEGAHEPKASSALGPRAIDRTAEVRGARRGDAAAC